MFFQVSHLSRTQRSGPTPLARGSGLQRGGCEAILPPLELHRKSRLGPDQMRAPASIEIFVQSESG